MADIMPTTTVMIFYRYGKSSNEIHADTYKLLMQGEVSGVKTTKNGINIGYNIFVIDSRTYLNRMPTKYLWYLFKNINSFAEYTQDYDFYGLPPGDEASSWIKSSIPLFEDGKKYSLNQYMSRFLQLLENSSGNYHYYGNANRRYGIKANTIIKEYGNTFEKMYGAYKLSSMIHNKTTEILKYRQTIADDMARILRDVGYNYIHVMSPMVIGSNIAEYMIIPDTINCYIPKFNYVEIGKMDGLDVTIAPTPITALRYKYKTDTNNVPNVIKERTSPAAAYDKDKRKFIPTKDEYIYGVNRESQDMEYYYNAFLSDDGEPYYQRKVDYDFAVKQTGQNTASFTKGEFIPEYVTGMQALIKDTLTGTYYRGTMARVSHMINVSAGACYTAGDLMNVKSIKAGDIDKEDMPNPMTKNDFTKDKQKALYRECLYDDKNIEPLISSTDVTSEVADYYEYIKRSACTLKQYIKLMFNINVDDKGNPLYEDMWLSLKSNDAPAMIKYEDNATKKLSRSIGNMFVEERYKVVSAYKLVVGKVVIDE